MTEKNKERYCPIFYDIMKRNGFSDKEIDEFVKKQLEKKRC